MSSASSSPDPEARSGDAHEQEYVLGTQDDELRRLGFQHTVWAEPTARLWEAAGFAPGERLLDLGCGPGYATADLSQLVGPAGSVVGVDVSRRFLNALEARVAANRLSNVAWHEADAAALPLESGSVHGVFARWVLSFTPDPGAVMAEVARVLAPGGRFAVLDYANYVALTIAPGSAAVDRVLQATGRSIADHGGDFEVGRRLPTLMAEHGLEVSHLAPIVRMARPDSALWQWPATFFANYLPVLESRALITAAERAAFEQVWRERSADPSAFLITPTMVGIVGVKA